MWLVLTAQASVVTALSALENGHEGRVGAQQHHTCVKGACACRYCSFVGFPISLLTITPLRHSRRIVQVPFLYGCKGTKTLRKESCMLIVFVLFNTIHS